MTPADHAALIAARDKKYRRLERWMKTAPSIAFVPTPVHPRNRPDHPIYGGHLRRLSEAEVEVNRQVGEALTAAVG